MGGVKGRHQHRLVYVPEIAARCAPATPTAGHRRECLRRLLAVEVPEIWIKHEIEIAGARAQRREYLARGAKGEPVEVRRFAREAKGKRKFTCARRIYGHFIGSPGMASKKPN